MDITNSIFTNVRDFLKYEIGAALGVRVWNGRWPNELTTGLISDGRPWAKPSVRVVATVNSPEQGFTSRDRAWVWRDRGYDSVEVLQPIDLSEASLKEFREWLGEVKAEAQRWS